MKIYHQLLVSKPKNYMKAQLKELAPNDMLKTLFSNLSKIHTVGTICPLIPVMAASIELSFSQMKLVKTHLRNTLNDK